MSQLPLSPVRVACCAAVLSAVQAASAQPTVDADLGRFDDVPDRSVQQLVIVTPVNPVRWYSVTLPRVADPHRLLDIFTWNATAYDTEIALYAADGTLIANDDDDGAQYFSALTFGITNTAAPGRVHPVTSPGQTAPVLNDGRDGSFSGASPGPTAATYYIAVTEYDATFANNFSVTRTGGLTGGLATLVVNGRTPGGFTPTTINTFGESDELPAHTTVMDVFVEGPVASVAMDGSSVGVSSNLPLEFFTPTQSWQQIYTIGNIPLGPRDLPISATTPIGDRVVAIKRINVRAPGYDCGYAAYHVVSPQAGVNLYTYDTTFANLDGPWGGCSLFTPSGDDIWIRWNATQNGTATFSTCNSDTGVAGAQPDTLLGLRRECYVSTFDACADDTPGCGYGTRLSNIPITAGQEYNIGIRAYDTPIVNGTLAVIFTAGCDSIDFNGDGLFPDTDDIADFIAVFGGAPCPTGACSDIDFNNDGLFPDTDDITALIRVFGGGTCL
ncbi:MAG: hypothetical protein U0637_13750 [Phycisphaerales bacterium]